MNTTKTTRVLSLAELNEADQIEVMPVVENAIAPVEKDAGIGSVALLTFALIVLLYHVLIPDLRTTHPLALSLRADSLRKVLTIVLVLGSAGLVFSAFRAKRNRVLTIAAGIVLAIFSLLVIAYNFAGFDGLSGIATVVEYAALVSVIVLWQPWLHLGQYWLTLQQAALPLLVFLAVIAGWEGVIRIFNIQQFLLPAPSVITNTFLTSYPKLVGQGWFTFQNALWGFAFGCGSGIVCGMIAARFPRGSRAVMPYAIAINAIPIVAFTPIMNQWFGINNPMSKISVVALLTFFTAMISAMRGLGSAPESAVELMRSYAANELEIFAKMRLPYALPYIFGALKVCATVAMIGAIVAEYFGGPLQGLGVNIADSAALSKYPLVWAQIVIASVLGLTFYFVISLVERLVMPWHISFRDQID
jgi:NitT/TauT family transport system permease protein